MNVYKTLWAGHLPFGRLQWKMTARKRQHELVRIGAERRESSAAVFL